MSHLQLYMYTSNKISKEKLDAAYQLLMEETTTFGKFEKVRTLVKGINPQIDKTLKILSDAAKKLKKLQAGDIIQLSAEALPEGTEEQKKRKKAVLLFISLWKDLRAEVKRIRELYAAEHADGEMTGQEHLGALAKIFAFAKGPFGLITATALVIAVVGGALAYLNSSAVSIIIKNRGCAPITPIVKMPVAVAGVKLPTETIPSGGQGVASIPPLTVTVDGTQKHVVSLTTLGISMQFNLQSEGIDLIFNNQSLLGKRTTINLKESKIHELQIRC